MAVHTPCMQLRAGTSGFSYAEWKGPFYPVEAKSKDFLRLYAEKLDCVEINNTFYRMPKRELLQDWASKVPAGFVFVLKAPQRITHRQKLEDCEQDVSYLWSTAQALGAALGPILFQLPPYFRCDLARLERFLGCLPAGMRAVLEFRHRSWFEPDVLALLESRNAALCYSDVDPSSEDDPGLEQPFAATADFGYVRLRREGYDEPALQHWIAEIRRQRWREAYVFFKHEPTAPGLALGLRALWARGHAAEGDPG